MKLIFCSFPLFNEILPSLDSEGMSLLHTMIGKNDYSTKSVAYIAGSNAKNTLLGAVIFSHTGDTGAIHTLCVRDGVQKKGLGTRLVDSVKAGCATVTVNGIHTALDFYKKLGFVPVDKDNPGPVIPLVWHR